MATDFSKYGTVTAPQSGSSDFSKYGTPISATGSKPIVSQPTGILGAGLKAGGEAISNLPESAWNFAKGIVSAVAHPIKTAEGVGNIMVGAEQTALNKIFDKNVQTESTKTFDSFTKMLKDRYGSLENLQKTATEDPFGFGADVVSLVEGGASLAGKTELLNRGISKTAQMAIKPVAKTAEAVGEGIGKTTKFGVSQATGLNADTITELMKNPQKFKDINPELRVETAQKVADALDTRLGELSDMGKGYEEIRKAGGMVTVPENTIKNVLNKYGVKLDANNQIITSPESRPLSAGDRVALQDFIDNYGGVTTHTNNSFLNTREALSNLAKYDSTKTNISTLISRDLRAEYDKLGKAQIKGLKDIDTAYAPERELLGQLKKDIFDAKGELKDTAISKIANLTGKGKEQVLERVKQIVPDIEERVRVIKAVENIEQASGFLKPGLYTRSLLQGGAVLTGNVPAIIGAILAQPQIAVPLLKGTGYAGAKAKPILDAVKAIANDVNTFQFPMQSVLLRDRK